MPQAVIEIATRHRSELIDVTGLIQQTVARLGVRQGVATVYVPHTTAAVTINEHADPDVAADILRFLDRLVPRDGAYAHAEGNADAHIKASLLGSSARVLIDGGKLRLGRWQGVFFCEFDGPRRRELWVAVEAPPAASERA